MEDEWENDNFEPPTIPVPAGNKWEGEDEEDEVKESWEDEEEEKKDEEKVEVVAKTTVKPKKSLQEKIAEKEFEQRLKREEYERKLKEQEEEMTPEERLRRQQESDLKMALETTFGEHESSGTGLDAMNPTTKEEFQEFSDLFNKKMQLLAKSEEYPAFAEELIRNICVHLNSLDLKKIKTTVDNMYLGKQKIEKGDKAKKNKGKGKAKLKMEGDNVVMEEYTASFPDYDDYDDFM